MHIPHLQYGVDPTQYGYGPFRKDSQDLVEGFPELDLNRDIPRSIMTHPNIGKANPARHWCGVTPYSDCYLHSLLSRPAATSRVLLSAASLFCLFFSSLFFSVLLIRDK